jgi:hypothetical protein
MGIFSSTCPGGATTSPVSITTAIGRTGARLLSTVKEEAKSFRKKGRLKMLLQPLD